MKLSHSTYNHFLITIILKIYFCFHQFVTCYEHDQNNDKTLPKLSLKFLYNYIVTTVKFAH